MGVDGKVLGESEISGLAAVGSCWTQLAPDSSTTGLLQAKAESIILAFGTDKSPKGMRPMDERTRAQNSLKGMQTAQDPHWSMRKKWDESSSRMKLLCPDCTLLTVLLKGLSVACGGIKCQKIGAYDEKLRLRL